MRNAAYRNRVLNGDMSVNAGLSSQAIIPTTAPGSVIASGVQCLDRWVINRSGNGTFSAAQIPVSSELPAFEHGLLLTNTNTTNARPTSQGLYQEIDGSRIADFQWGTSASGSATVLSFWASSSVAGSFGVVLVSASNAYGALYTIPTANAWTYVTLTVPPPPPGTTWQTAAGTRGLWLVFTFTTAGTLNASGGHISANEWRSVTNVWGVAGQTDLTLVNGATFGVTGVQYEPGSAAMAFERRIEHLEVGLPLAAASAAAARRGAVPVGSSWMIMQDVRGNGTRDLSIWNGQTATHSFYIGTNGNVGVGTTSPIGKLHAWAPNSDPIIGVQNGASSMFGMQSDRDLGVKFGSFGGGNIDGLYINKDKYVGIGTVTPGRPLEVSSTVGANGMFGLVQTTVGAECSLRLSNNTDRFWFMGINAWNCGRSNLAIGSTTALLNLHASDNVGIGTTTPAAKLTIHNTVPGSAVSGNGNSWTNSLALTGYGRAWSMGVEGNGDSAKVLGFFCYNTVDLSGTRIIRGYIVGSDGPAANTPLNFTGQHRCFVAGRAHAELRDLAGLVVVADQNRYIGMSGGVKTGRAAITNEESLPVVDLASKARDKRVFGVVARGEDPDKREDAYGCFVAVFAKERGDTRAYINSVGEGAMWVCDADGPIESGDYITTSGVLGYGTRQEEAQLCNFTVAKATMDCDFSAPLVPKLRVETGADGVNELDADGNLRWVQELDPATGEPVVEPAYELRYVDASGTIIDRVTYEQVIVQGTSAYRAALIGCTYHCG